MRSQFSRSLTPTSVLLKFLLLIAILGVYSNSFNNQFQFDDSHSIVNNPWIRDLKNIPKFFTDGTTFSVLPSNQSYRPLVSASLAIDYWLGGGLEPFYFHLSTIIWYLLHILVIVAISVRIFSIEAVSPKIGSILAILVGAVYGLHPAIADTVNYVIQRGELYAGFSIVLSLLVYQVAPRRWRIPLSIIPFAIGTLAKPPAIVFPIILFFYVILFEERLSLSFWQRTFPWRKLFGVVLRLSPLFVAVGVLYWFQIFMTPKSYTPGGTSVYHYIITQPYVHFIYFKTLFVPTGLTVDSDLSLFTSPMEGRALVGFGFYLFLAIATFVTSSRAITRPIAFGLIWFVISNLPTSVVPLAEVTNNHRMFIPFIGLVISLVWSAFLLIRYLANSSVHILRTIGVAIATLFFMLLPASAHLTMTRNLTWATADALWLDTVQKSPKNGRALMNYGLTLMAKGQYKEALSYFLRAEELLPFYSSLSINIGIVEGALNNKMAAEMRFARAIELGRNQFEPYFFYGRWLKQVGRLEDSKKQLRLALLRSPNNFIAHYLLLDIAIIQRDWRAINDITSEALARVANDAKMLEYKQKGIDGQRKEIQDLQGLIEANPSHDNLINLSFAYYRSGDMLSCIAYADKALQVNPKSALAYNNKSAAYAALSRWRESLDMAESALRIEPSLKIAQNNRALAVKMLN